MQAIPIDRALASCKSVAKVKNLMAEEGEDEISTRKTELYGFIFFILAQLAFVLWVIWAFVPDTTLRDLGVYYFPSKWWAVALPIWFVVLLITVVLASIFSQLVLAPRMDDVDLLGDNCTQVYDTVYFDEYDVPAVHDMSISFVNSLLYDDMIK